MNLDLRSFLTTLFRNKNNADTTIICHLTKSEENMTIKILNTVSLLFEIDIRKLTQKNDNISLLSVVILEKSIGLEMRNRASLIGFNCLKLRKR